MRSELKIGENLFTKNILYSKLLKMCDENTPQQCTRTINNNAVAKCMQCNNILQ